MKISYDLHIHSKLSSCSSELMSPNNILNMCMLKGLDLVSITDHNSSKQQEVISEISVSYDFLYLYGIELSLNEGYHILAYFDTLDKINTFDSYIDSLINKEIIVNHHDQKLFNIYDEEIGFIPYDLHQNIKVSLNEIAEKVRENDGLIILAHIDRPNSGILQYNIDLSNIDFDGFEVDHLENLESIYKKYPFLKKYKILRNSDSHDLEMINENEYLELETLTFEGLKAWLRNE